MPRKRYTPEEILQHLRAVELDTGKGLAALAVCRKLGITEQTYYWWKKEYGGLRVDQPKRLKALEQENLRLKRDRGEPSVESLDPQGSRLGKLLSPARQREAVGHAMTALHVSERRACRAISKLRFAYRYQPQRDASQEQLRQRVIALAKAMRVICLPPSDGSGETAGLGRGERSRVYDLAAGGPASAAESTQARPTLARRWVMPPAAARVLPSCLVL